MYTKQNLIVDIKNYQPFDNVEAQNKAAILEVLNNTDNCFLRSDLPGHFTAGAWLISADKKRVLLTHHAIYDEWMHLGGHADGDMNLLNVSTKELIEESGISDAKPVTGNVFDITIDHIPLNIKKNEPPHLHYDINFLFSTDTTDFVVSNESKALKWFTLEEIKNRNPHSFASVQRMILKWERLQ